jgi:hypothetical protein
MNCKKRKTTLQEEVDYLFTHHYLKERWQMIYQSIPFSFKDFCANILPNLAAIFKSSFAYVELLSLSYAFPRL